MKFAAVTLPFLWLGATAGMWAGEDPSLPPYHWPDDPKYSLRTEYQPLKGWKIETFYRGDGEVFLRESGRERKANGVKSKDNPTAKGLDENLYLLHFDYNDYRALGGPPIAEMEIDPTRPAFLGWDFYDFSTRFHRWTGERGLSRKYVNQEFSGLNAAPLDTPRFHVDPASQEADWERFLLPVVTAEGGGDYLVINAFDRGGMTVGFIQMVAHTPNDMIPLMRHLIQSEELKSDPYANPERWFPELGITPDGKLGYKTEDAIVSLEECTCYRNSNEGFHRPPSWAYFREDFVRFCNPDVTEINRAELHFAARWMMWSLSAKMRQAQLQPSKDNVVATLQELKNVPKRVSAADAAIAAVILHWNDGGEYRKRVSALLNQPSPVAAFLSLESREGQPGAKTVYGRLIAKQKPWFQAPSSERQVLNQRIEAVRMLFEQDPGLLARLNALQFDFETGELVGKIALGAHEPVAPRS